MIPATTDVSPANQARTVTVANSSVWLVLDALTGSLVAAVLSISVARALGPDVLGVYSYLMWLVNAGAVIASTGIAIGMHRFAAELLGRGDIYGLDAILARGRRYQQWSAVTLVVAGLVVAMKTVPPEYAVATVFAVLSIAPVLLVAVPSAGLGAAQAYREAVLASVVAVTLHLFVGVAALGLGWNVTGLAGALLLSRCADWAFKTLAWKRVRRKLMATGGGGLTVDEGAGRDLDAATALRFRDFALGLSALLAIEFVVWDRSEMIFLNRFSTASQIALYSLSFNIVQQALLLPKMFGWAIGSNLMLEHGRAPARVSALSADAMRYVFLVAAPVAVGVWALSRSIVLLLYGARFEAAAPVLAVVAMLAVMRGAVAPVQELLRIREQQWFLVRFGLVMAVLNIGLDVWLIPRGHAIGAAWANGVAQAIAVVGLTVFAAARLDLHVPWRDLARIVLACVPMFIVARSAAALTTPAVGVLVGVPLGALTYALGVRVTRALKPVDVMRLRALASLLPRSLRFSYGRAIALMAAPDHA